MDIKKKLNPKEIISNIAFAIIFAATFQSLFFQPFAIPSGSMMPTLEIGDKILVQKFAYGYSKYSFPLNMIPFSGKIFDKNKPIRGDVVVFKMPIHNNEFFIKRVIAIPGDVVEIRKGQIYVNGTKNEQKYEKTFIAQNDQNHQIKVHEFKERNSYGMEYEIYKLSINGALSGDNMAPIKIPQGKYFFMGDNRDNSNDSRFDYIGLVDEDKIIGKARIIFFSSKAKIYEFWKWKNQTNLSRMFKRLDKNS